MSFYSLEDFNYDACLKVVNKQLKVAKTNVFFSLEIKDNKVLVVTNYNLCKLTTKLQTL